MVSLLLNYYRKPWAEIYNTPVFWKFFACSIFPFFWNFGFGAVLFLNWEKIKPYFKDRFFIWCGVYLVSFFISRYISTNIQLIDYFIDTFSMFVLSCLVISLAFSYRHLSDILKRNDISYGVYIYHMPVTNFFILFWGMDRMGSPFIYFSILVTVFIISFSSWKMIELPSLKLKRYKTAN